MHTAPPSGGGHCCHSANRSARVAAAAGAALAPSPCDEALQQKGAAAAAAGRLGCPGWRHRATADGGGQEGDGSDPTARRHVAATAPVVRPAVDGVASGGRGGGCEIAARGECRDAGALRARDVGPRREAESVARKSEKVPEEWKLSGRCRGCAAHVQDRGPRGELAELAAQPAAASPKE